MSFNVPIVNPKSKSYLIAFHSNHQDQCGSRVPSHGQLIESHQDSMVAIARGIHLLPFRTEKLSPFAPMVLPQGGRVGRCLFLKLRPASFLVGLFYFPKLIGQHVLLIFSCTTFDPMKEGVKPPVVIFFLPFNNG